SGGRCKTLRAICRTPVPGVAAGGSTRPPPVVESTFRTAGTGTPVALTRVARRGRPRRVPMFDTIRFAARVWQLRALPRRGAEAVRATQERRWWELLRHAVGHSPFYRDRLRGLDPDLCRPADLPPLTKSELMA